MATKHERIDVYEVEKYRAQQQLVATDAVYIPGFVNKNFEEEHKNKKTGKFKLVNIPTRVETISEFTSAFGDKPREFTYTLADGTEVTEYDKSYICAYYLLLYGLPVYYEVIDIDLKFAKVDSEEAFAFKNKYVEAFYRTLEEDAPYALFEKLNDSMSDEEEAESDDDTPEEALTEGSRFYNLSDKSLYIDLGFITSGGYPAIRRAAPTVDKDGKTVINRTSTLATLMELCTRTRGDAVALIDCDVCEANVNSIMNSYTVSSFKSSCTSFAAGFAPWLDMNIKSNWVAKSEVDTTAEDTPKFEQTELDDTTRSLMPATVGYLLAYANAMNNGYPDCYAMAGAKRGVIPMLIEPAFSIGERRIDSMMQRRDKVAVNPIANISPFGTLIWGNRTLKDNSIVGNLTPLSFLNVRIMVNAIKKLAYLTCKRCMFDQRSEVLWINFRSYLTPYLDKLVSLNGLKNYIIEQVPTDELAKIKARIWIQPIEAVEYFEVGVIVTESTIDLSIEDEETVIGNTEVGGIG